MFQVKNLTVTHKKDLTTLVEGLSFTLAPGDRAAIIGEEGNGKSTVLKLLYDPALAEPYAEWTGEIVDKGLRKGYLAQELRPPELEAPVWEFCQAVPAFEEADPRALDRAARHAMEIRVISPPDSALPRSPPAWADSSSSGSAAWSACSLAGVYPRKPGTRCRKKDSFHTE